MELKFYNPEFEQIVRKQLNIFDRPITVDDAKTVIELDISDIDFKDEDDSTLICFSNLKTLELTSDGKGPSFWAHFPMMEDLSLSCESLGGKVDFESFSHMENLRSLSVCGDDLSCCELKNLPALMSLSKLRELYLCDFAELDLSPIEEMSQLKRLGILYSYGVKNISAVGKLKHLENLILTGLYVEDINFLDMLPDNVELELCGIEIYGQKNIDVEKFKRFSKRDICEIMVKDQYWEYVDLSALDS